MNKYNCGILKTIDIFIHKKEGNSAISDNMDKLEGYYT